MTFARDVNLAELSVIGSPRPPRDALPQWLRGDPEARRTIEEEIDRMPKRKKSN
jgi:hypothetical protein